MQSMATSRTTKPRASTRTPKSDGRRSKPAAKAEAPRSFAEIGRAAAKEAQRKALLAACADANWKLAVVAETLAMGDSSAVIRALKALAPAEYEQAKAAGDIAPGKHRDD